MTIRKLAAEMKELTAYEQSWILDRFVAQQELNALVREAQKQSEARNKFLLQQLRYDKEVAINSIFKSMSKINAKP